MDCRAGHTGFSLSVCEVFVCVCLPLPRYLYLTPMALGWGITRRKRPSSRFYGVLKV